MHEPLPWVALGERILATGEAAQRPQYRCQSHFSNALGLQELSVSCYYVGLVVRLTSQCHGLPDVALEKALEVHSVVTPSHVLSSWYT